MKKLLIFKSIDARKEDPTNKPEDFTTRFFPQLILDVNKDYYLALDHISMFASWHNIRPEYNNDKLKISKDKGKTYETITFPSGIFSYDDINQHIHKMIGPLTAGGKEYGIDVKFDFSTYKVFINLSDGYYIDFTTSSSGYFNNLLGFESKVLTSSGYGKNFPNITNSIDNLYLKCDLLSDSVVSGKLTNTLFAFSTNTKTRSLPFVVYPKVEYWWRKINKKYISSVRFYMVDDRDKIVDLNGIDISIAVMLKEE